MDGQSSQRQMRMEGGQSSPRWVKTVDGRPHKGG